jgi:hypothetical protein
VLVETYNLFGDPALVLDRPRGDIAIARAPDRWNDRIAVRLPRNRFDGKVTVNWLDAGGVALATRTYATNDNLFELPIPSRDFAGVNVYAEDLRSGADALGFLDLRPPPEPEPEVAKQPEPATPAKPHKVAAVRSAVPRPANLPDPIGHFDFERPATPKTTETADAGTAPQATPKPASAAAVAVDPGTRKGQD